MHSKQQNPFNYKNGKIESTNEQENLEHKIMRWIDFILKWLFKFVALYIIYEKAAISINHIIKYIFN
jgi:hypothetical protein